MHQFLQIPQLEGHKTYRVSESQGRLDLRDLGFYRQTLQVTSKDGYVFPSYFEDNLQERVEALTPEKRERYKVQVTFSDSDYLNEGLLYPSSEDPLVKINSHLGFDDDFDLWRWNRKLPGIIKELKDKLT